MVVELLVPIAAFVMIVVTLSLFTGLISTAILNKTIREGMRSHPESVPALIAKLDERQPWADALLGWIMLAAAAGLVLLSLFEDYDERREMMQAAVIPVVIGVTVLLYVRFARSRHDKAMKS